MKRSLAWLFALGLVAAAFGQTRVRDLVYLQEGGTKYTMDVFEPAKPSGAGVVYVVSGGYYSSPAMIDPAVMKPFTDQGLTVFAVVHGSQPNYTIPQILPELRHAVRFIRTEAAQYHVDPKRLGLTGISSGGHLTLMVAATGDSGNPHATDPVDRESSMLKAAVAISPGTDFLNWGKPQNLVLDDKVMSQLRSAFGLTDATSAEKVMSVSRDLSPVYRVTNHFPPTLLVHGDADTLVPMQQSQAMDAALEKHHVKHKLILVPGGGHDEKTFFPGVSAAVAWFLANL